MAVNKQIGGLDMQDLKVTLLLADSSQVYEGKLNILGGGWNIIGPEPTPMAIAMKIDVPWTDTNHPHKWELRLMDQDGNQPVTVSTPAGPQPLIIGGEFEVGRPAGHKPGTPVSVPIALNIGPLPLSPGGFYVWKLLIDGETENDWSVTFQVRPKR